MLDKGGRRKRETDSNDVKALCQPKICGLPEKGLQRMRERQSRLPRLVEVFGV